MRRYLNRFCIAPRSKGLAYGLSGSIVQPFVEREAIQPVHPAGHSTKQIREANVGVSRSKDRKVEKHASHADCINPDRSRRPVVAGESFHPHGRKHQVDLERGRCRWRGVVAPQRIWIVPLTPANPRWVTSKQAGFSPH